MTGTERRNERSEHNRANERESGYLFILPNCLIAYGFTPVSVQSLCLDLANVHCWQIIEMNNVVLLLLLILPPSLDRDLVWVLYDLHM